jgi:hypothetical protein
MATADRKPESSTPRPEKPQQEAITDLPTPEQNDKDAQQVKGGRPKNIRQTD